MNKEEQLKLGKYIKERYELCDEDIKTFNLSVIDESKTYEEVMKIVEPLLPKTKEMIEAEQQEAIRLRLEKDLEMITADSKELEELYKETRSEIEMVCDKVSKGLLLHGETSLGKSYQVKSVLKAQNKKPIDSKGEGDYMFVSGHITPMKFYEQLYECRDKIVVFDDCDILGNIIIINMIKAGLNENSGNIIHYHTSSSKMTIPSSFEFKGQMIILLNKVPKSCEHLRAIKSRIPTIEMKFDREQVVKIIHLIAHKGKEQAFKDTTLDERVMIAKWLKENTTLATTNLNIRLYIRALTYYTWDRNYEWKKDWKTLALKQIENDVYATLLVQNCSVDVWCEETGLGAESMRKYKRKFGLTRTYNVSGLNTKQTPIGKTVKNLGYVK